MKQISTRDVTSHRIPFPHSTGRLAALLSLSGNELVSAHSHTNAAGLSNVRFTCAYVVYTWASLVRGGSILIEVVKLDLGDAFKRKYSG